MPPMRGRRPIRESSLSMDISVDDFSLSHTSVGEIRSQLDADSTVSTIEFPTPPDRVPTPQMVSYAYLTHAGMLAEFVLPGGAYHEELPITILAQVSKLTCTAHSVYMYLIVH